MKEHVYLQKARRKLLASTLALGAFFAVGWQPVLATDLLQTSCEKTRAPASANTAEGQNEKAANASKGTAAMRVYIDPKTGEVVEPPAGAPAAELPKSQANALSTSVDRLEETPSPMPGGGVLLDLKGRFQSPLVATPGADGKITIQHMPMPAEPGSGKKQ
jgi:hypothetical protein